MYCELSKIDDVDSPFSEENCVPAFDIRKIQNAAFAIVKVNHRITVALRNRLLLQNTDSRF